MRWLIKFALFKKLFLLIVAGMNWLIDRVGQLVLSGYSSIHSVWQNNPKFWRHFSINFIIGIAIAVFLHFIHHTRFVSETENLVMDSMMYVNQNTARMMGEQATEKPLQFTFIDIDEDSYRMWNEPAKIPRDKLLKLIEYASNDSAAKAIVVDVDFSNSANEADDQALLNFLQSYNENYPPLFLIRDFYPASKFTQGKTNQIRPSIIDQVELGKQVYQAQPIFKLSNYDQKVRYWELLRTGCSNNKPQIIPAFQLLADAHLNSPEGLPSVLQQLRKKTPKSCNDIKSEEKPTGKLVYGDKSINFGDVKNKRLGERIIFTLPWTGKSLASNELLVKPAHRLTEAEPDSLSSSAVDGRVVVIGASFQDSRDYHQTPLGEMPGGIIIINAIKSLHLYGQIKPPSTGHKLLIELVLILFMSWAFARFSSYLGAITTTVMIMVILVPISFYFFKYGLWVDLAAPILGMQLHQIVAKYEEDHTAHQKPKKTPPKYSKEKS